MKQRVLELKEKNGKSHLIGGLDNAPMKVESFVELVRAIRYENKIWGLSVSVIGKLLFPYIQEREYTTFTELSDYALAMYLSYVKDGVA